MKAAEFIPDDSLEFVDASVLRARPNCCNLGEPYRLSHLPLVAPESRLVISTNSEYEMGRRAHVAYSAVIRVPFTSFALSSAFSRLEAELHEAPAGAKIAWDSAAARRDRLHATVAPLSRQNPPSITAAMREAMREVGPFQVQIRSVFAGATNFGRLYLCLYPEKRAEGNPLAAVQRILGVPERGLYLVGLFNLTDDLTERETDSLLRIIERWWGVELGELRVKAIDVLATRDDLALDSWTVETLPLAP